MTRVPHKELNHFMRNVLAVVALAVPKESAYVIALEGELGAGKTTFVQALAKEFGIEEIVQSPTYVLMKSYPIDWRGFKKLVHIDLYRMENADEFDTLRPDTFLGDRDALVCVEWPERAAGKLPEPDLVLSFSSEGSIDEREIKMEVPRV